MKTFYNLINNWHAKLCYQLFITPINVLIPKNYRHYARRACEYLKDNRDTLLTFKYPRHHAIHHFAQPKIKNAKKILIAHGWVSCSAYMIKLIRALHAEGYEIFALDFPAHGIAKGWQCTWIDAVTVLQHVINKFGPFYAVLGHSFGGSMLLNTLILAHQYSNWHIKHDPQHVILISSPTRMRTPVGKMARFLKLNRKSYQNLRQIFTEQTIIDLKRLNFKHYKTNIPFLCIHGTNDSAIHPEEAIVFCKYFQNATLSLIPDLDHINVLIDDRVSQKICEFLNK